jgi:NCAIR mutase (PurE)-related protein
LQIKAIATRILSRSGRILITRVNEDVYRILKEQFSYLKYNPGAQCIYFPGSKSEIKKHKLKKGYVLVVCAGTSDLPVAEEAAITVEVTGCRVKTLYDVGVAGIHRLLNQQNKVEKASVIICVAGMEGALPSVVGGLANCPVIAVPTSVGYGASFKGVAALLGMLNSCASGVTVVNIDNGFGAGFAAYQMLKLAQKSN